MGKEDQEFLKKLDKIDQTGNKIIYWIFVIFYAAGTFWLLVEAIYFGVGAIQGNGTEKQFTDCCVVLLILAAIPVCCRLVDWFIKGFFKKDNAYEPHLAKQPASLTLEDALHKLSTQTAVIVWDVTWGCVLFSLLCLLAFNMGNRLRIMLLCVCMTIIILAGHALFHFIWKKRSFTKRMLCNTSKYILIDRPSDYANAVEESLKRNLLSYEKEFILTDEYILGCTQQGVILTPAAIKREDIEELVFFYQRIVNGRYSRTVGILSCRTSGKKPVDLVLGLQPKVNKVLKILKYHHISWREDGTIYV